MAEPDFFCLLYWAPSGYFTVHFLIVLVIKRFRKTMVNKIEAFENLIPFKDEYDLILLILLSFHFTIQSQFIYCEDT